MLPMQRYPQQGARRSIATYERGGIEGPPRWPPAGHPGSRAEARIRRHRGAARREQRPLRPAHWHGVSGLAQTGIRWTGSLRLVRRRWAQQTHIPTDGSRPTRPGRATQRMAPIFLRRVLTPAGEAMADDLDHDETASAESAQAQLDQY